MASFVLIGVVISLSLLIYYLSYKRNDHQEEKSQQQQRMTTGLAVSSTVGSSIVYD